MEMVTKILSGLPTLHVGFRLRLPKDVETNQIEASRETPGVNFIIIFFARFFADILMPKITKLCEALLYEIFMPKTRFRTNNERIKR